MRWRFPRKIARDRDEEIREKLVKELMSAKDAARETTDHSSDMPNAWKRVEGAKVALASADPPDGKMANVISIGTRSRTRPMPSRFGRRRTRVVLVGLMQEYLLKTRDPLILTARIEERDLEPFDRLRQTHFPPNRSFLRAHLTMFHRLPGEYQARIVDRLNRAVEKMNPFIAEVSGVRHLGAGVAFVIASPELDGFRATLKSDFISWLGPQDRQPWQPHITIQNKVTRAKADALHRELYASFSPCHINIVGVDLWAYLGGPWQHAASTPFGLTGKE